MAKEEIPLKEKDVVLVQKITFPEESGDSEKLLKSTLGKMDEFALSKTCREKELSTDLRNDCICWRRTETVYLVKGILQRIHLLEEMSAVLMFRTTYETQLTPKEK